jgi:uncharacterized membrane protein
MQIPIIVLLQYTLISSRMLVSKVDRGDLSYILCSNTSRTQVSSTAITFLLFTNFVNFLTVFIPTIIFVHNESLIPLIIFCIAYFTFCISLSGISVLFSAYCDKTVKYMIIVGGIFLISFVFTIIGYIGDTLDNVLKNFKYLSVIYFIGTNGFDKTDGIPNIN